MLFEILSVCKGGGYNYCRTFPLHPNRNKKGLYPLHRVILENKLNRLLNHDEDAHHIDGNKNNNSEENISPMGHNEHISHHSIEKRNKNLQLECKCGKQFFLSPRAYRLRINRNVSEQIFCSRRCGSKYTHNLMQGELE